MPRDSGTRQTGELAYLPQCKYFWIYRQISDMLRHLPEKNRKEEVNLCGLKHFWLSVLTIAMAMSVSNALAEAPLITVQKYFGNDYSRVRYRELTLQNGAYQASGTYLFDSTGKPIQETYLPEGAGTILTDHQPKYWGDNPVKSEIEAAVASGHLTERQCDLLRLNQLFSVESYVDRGIYSRADADALLANASKDLKPNQVTFFETDGTISEIMARRKRADMRFARVRPNVVTPEIRKSEKQLEDLLYQKSEVERAIPFGQKKEIPRELEAKINRVQNQLKRWRARTYYDTKTSTSWLVSGQTPNGLARLPLEVPEKGFHLDRTRFKAAWEIGRSRNLKDSDMWYALKAAVDQAGQEAKLLGISEDESWIVAHSPDKLHQRLHKSYGLEFISDHPDGPGHQVWGTKLSEFRKTVENRIKKFNPAIQEFPDPAARFEEFKKHADLNIPIRDEPVLFRNFDGYLKSGQVAPTTWIEFFSGKDGASSPLLHRFEDHGSNLDMDLFHRMQEYFGKHTPDWTNLHDPPWLDHESYLKSRFQERHALVIDDARKYTHEFVRWKSVMQQAVSYAREHHISEIAIPWHDLHPDLAGIPHQTEELYLAAPKWNDWGLFKLQSQHAFDLNIYWFKVDDVEKYMGSKAVEKRSLLERFWDQPEFMVQ